MTYNEARTLFIRARGLAIALTLLLHLLKHAHVCMERKWEDAATLITE